MNFFKAYVLILIRVFNMIDIENKRSSSSKIEVLIVCLVERSVNATVSSEKLKFVASD
jgi:hypothetical protein